MQKAGLSQEERKRLDVILEQKDRGEKKNKNAAEEAIGVETWQGQERAL